MQAKLSNTGWKTDVIQDEPESQSIVENNMKVVAVLHYCNGPIPQRFLL